MQVTLFTPHKGQRKVIDGFADSQHKFGVVATGRQYGKSLLGQNLMLYWLLQNPKQKGAWISPIYSQGKKVFRELLGAANKIIEHKNEADLTMRFMNGSTLQFLSAERYDSIRGFSFNYLVVDEAAFIKEIAMQEAIFPTLSAIGKKCLIISTPKSKNWFYTHYLKGSTDNDDYISFRGISTDNTHIDADFIAEQAKSLPPEIFKQEYLAEFSESGNDVFSNVDAVCNLNNWSPYERQKRYYCGIDLGLQHDYSVITVIADDGRVVRVERINGTSYAEIAEQFSRIIKQYRCAGGYCEVNGPGLPVWELINKQEKKIKQWTTNNSNKTNGIRNLIYDIQELAIELPSKEVFPYLYEELNAFTYKVSATGTTTFSAPNGFHDDCVMSLMLANECRKQLGSTKSRIYVGGSYR